jgi:hypothetical protein
MNGRSMALFLGVVALGSCYRPSFHDCQLQCVSASGCPQGLYCVDGFCRLDLEPADRCDLQDGGFVQLADAHLTDLDGSLQPLDGAVADAHTVPDARGPFDAHVADARVADARVIDASGPPDVACTCDPISQSCCGSGDACDIRASESECRDVTVAGQQAAACSAPEQCARGYTCLAGTCHEFCTSDSQCVGGGALCDVRVGSSTVMACTSLCDPVSSSGCAAGFACEVARSSTTSRWHTDCRAAGSVTAGGACVKNTDCGRGFVCTGNPARCAPYCNSQQGDEGCPGAPTCQISSDPPTVSGVEWGACL